MPEIEFVEQGEQQVLSIRTKTRVELLPQLIGDSYHRIMTYLTELGAQPAGAPFTAYFNMDMQNLEVELGFPVMGVFADQEDIRFSTIPAGKVVACLYKGPYSGLGSIYEAMNEWIQSHGYEATGAAYEYYFTGPEVPEEDHLTRIVLPLK